MTEPVRLRQIAFLVHDLPKAERQIVPPLPTYPLPSLPVSTTPSNKNHRQKFSTQKLSTVSQKLRNLVYATFSVRPLSNAISYYNRRRNQTCKPNNTVCVQSP